MLKKYAQILPIILKLCHFSFVTYYSNNYAGILGSGLLVNQPKLDFVNAQKDYISTHKSTK